MKQKLIEILERFCPNNVYLQGTMNADESYPETFITFWVNYTEDDEHYDDDVCAWAWNFSVMVYSSNPLTVNTLPFEIMQALKGAGFIPQGKGNDIPSDEPNFTGWATEYIYKEINEGD